MPSLDLLHLRSPSSALYKLYPIIILWGHKWSRKSILIHSDNAAVVHILNKGWSNCPAIMQFMRRLTLVSAQHQFIIQAAHVPGSHKCIADSLSFQIQTLGARLACSSNTSSSIFRNDLKLAPQQQNLSATSREMILSSIATCSLSAYLAGWSCFKAFHSNYHLPLPSVDVTSICQFITHSVLQVRSATINMYIHRNVLLHETNKRVSLPVHKRCSHSHAHERPPETQTSPFD